MTLITLEPLYFKLFTSQLTTLSVRERCSPLPRQLAFYYLIVKTLFKILVLNFS